MTVIVWDGKTLAADRQMTNNGLARPVTKAWRLQRPGRGYHELVAITGAGSARLVACFNRSLAGKGMV